VDRMAGELLPLFPLSQPLMPRASLPLRIFEPRYAALLADVTAPGGDHLFGVVALTRGAEVLNSRDPRPVRFADVGTVAEIVQVEATSPDPATIPGAATATILAIGRRRFRVHRVMEGSAPYLRAEVRYLREFVGAVPAGLPDTAQMLVAEYTRLLLQLTGMRPDEPPRYPRDPVALSYRLARDAALLPADKQQLLAAKSAAERLQRLVKLVRREIALVRGTRSVAVAPGILNAALRRD
jgi:Lon protease-like protein